MRIGRNAAFSLAAVLLSGPLHETTSAGGPPALDYFSVNPCRVLDTRLAGQGPALSSGTPRNVTMTGVCGIPVNAESIAINVTAVGPTGAGNLRLYAGGGAVPVTSALNFGAGQTRGNNGVFPLAANGELAMLATVSGSGSLHVVVDVVGYFAVAGCTTPAECPGQDTECQTRTCNLGVCGLTFQPAGTVISTQILGDCHRNQCDGLGNIVPVIDDGDPFIDGNQCTDDLCIAGTPVNPPSPAGTACTQNGGTMCDGAGNCVP